MVRMTPNDHVAYGLVSAYSSVRALRVGQYVDQSSSRGLEKFCEDIPTSPEVMRTNKLNFRPNVKFLRSRVFWGPHPHLSVRYQGLVNL